MPQLNSGLARPIVWSVPSNRVAVIGSTIGMVIVAVIRLLAHRRVTVGNVFGTLAALFLAWAVAREVDPDEPVSAAVALALAALAILQFGFASLWVVVGALLGVRLIVGTVGLRLHLWDVVALAALAAFLGYRDAAWIVIVVMALGALLAGGRNRWATALLVAAAGFAGMAFSHTAAGFVLPGSETLIVFVGVVAATLILGFGPPPVTVTDVHPRPLRPDRLIAGQVAVAAVVVIMALQTGLAASVGPLAAALLGAAAVRLARNIRAGVA